ncbi:unnamed protein product [Phytophthora lilii]|uniref:Unnamed protein product n=1 Tax=Phytophthora lilii TaxID=2077276 RepID=A0A9W6UD15_9STRA|nr:unnamed protein product [Phytophthora lilii]
MPKLFFRDNEKDINVLVLKWLIRKGLPYTACDCETFADIMRAATGNLKFAMLSRDMHDRLLNGQLQLFCDLIGELLAFEFQKACRLKFVNLMHDSWTSCGKDSIVGASIAFIDSSWRFRYIAMLASGKNDGHNAPSVASVIEKGFKLKYDIDIKVMTRFTMSDTAPSSKNVADLIDTEQEDCLMHLLNLCIGYGIGLNDNIQTASVWNEVTESWDKTSKQRNALRKIQDALSYPDLDPLTDSDVRVGGGHELISGLALVETQSENMVLSYMVVFRRLADNKLKSFKFDAMAIEAPRSRDANESSHRRVVRTQQQFYDAGKTCPRRTLLQLQARFPKVSKACVLLDPRIKSSAKKIAADRNIPRKEEKAIYKGGLDYLREEYRKVYTEMTKQGRMSLS